MSQITWGKIGSIIVVVCGVIVQYLSQAQGAVVAMNLSPDLGFALSFLGAIAGAVLQTIHTHQLEVLANSMPGAPVVPAPVAVKFKVGRLVVLFFGLMLLASSAFADWQIPSKNISFESKHTVTATANVGDVNPTVQGDDEIDLVPTASLGFGIGPTGTPSYGYSGAWSLIFEHVSQSSTVGVANVAPYFGLGAALYFDLGPAIDSNFQSAALLDGGLNIIGPQIDNLVPTAEVVWNFNSGTRTAIVGFSAPFELLESAIIPLIK